MKKVILTGSTGFLGSLIKTKLLKFKNIELIELSNEMDLVNLNSLKPLESIKIDIVIHCAGLAHTKKKTSAFYQINHLGTKNLLTVLTKNSPQNIIFISTVAVYGEESGNLIKENHPLNPKDYYGKSKLLAENEIINWADKNNSNYLIFRPSLIVGENPKGNLKKMIDGIKKGYYFNINNGGARRSMILAEDLAELIITSFDKTGIYNICSDENPSYFELSNKILNNLRINRKPLNLPYYLCKIVGKLGDLITILPFNSKTFVQLTSSLTFDNNYAKKKLKWAPKSILENFKL